MISFFFLGFLWSIQVSSEAMAVPDSSKEGHELNSRRRKHHISESGVLVIEYAEPSDAGCMCCQPSNSSLHLN